jgi:choline-phosphate cytidylyltransferase
MFHVGHLNSLEAAFSVACQDGNPQLVVGVVSDKDALSYKRKPIIDETSRALIVESIYCVKEVIRNCPLILTPEFLEEHKIDLVVHGFASEEDREKQKDFFAPIAHKFREIPYTPGISTSMLIDRLKALK